MSVLFLLAPLSSILALVFSYFLGRRILKVDEGTDKMKEIARAVREGAQAYIKRQYSVVGAFFVLVFFLLLYLSFKGYLVMFVPFAFITGGFFSALSGYIGMRTATSASARTANAAKTSLNGGLRVAFDAGTVMGLIVVGLGLLDLVAWFYILDWFYSNNPIPAGFDKVLIITSILLTRSLGASLQALFARVGGGIYTKAADVGADLVGKVEAGIPEDDPRNPAVIADNVGDNVGDVAGMGADLFESYVDSMIAAMVLGVAVMPIFGSKAVILPMMIAAIGIISAILGNFIVFNLKGKPHTILNGGIWSAALIMTILSFVVIKHYIGDLNIFWALITGLIAGIVIGLATEYYTSDSRRPVQNVAKASETGSATNIISGLSLGFMSTIIPVLAVVVAIYLSHEFAGLYGVAIAAVGMLSTLGITLATDTYGPVADNAAGIAEMAGMGSEVREKAEELDAVGNTTAAVGKGFAIGSAALTALVLLVSFGQAVGLKSVNLLEANTIIGLFIGGVLPFVFSALTMKAVGKATGQMVEEVRRQFREISGLMNGETEPDYKKCIDISTNAALKQMIIPGLLAILVPVIIGLWLGPASLAGLLAGSIITGFLLAVFMANAGGAWDNAKKFIEADNFGGKGSDAHKAAVVGDTVGDPFKDTAGPALNILIKLMAIISIVIAPLLMM